MCFFFCFCYGCFKRCRKKTRSRELWRRSPGRARKKKNHNRIFTTCLSTQQQQKYFGTGMQNQQRRAYIYKIILGRRRRHKSLTCSSRRSKTSSRNISSAQTRRQIVGGKADYRLSKWWAANRQGQSSPAVPSQALQHPLFSFTLRARGWRLKASPL